jgi:serine/threonine-protein kinase
LTTIKIANASENPSNPFFSPDNKWVAYRSVAENKLKKVPVKGGTAMTLCDIGSFSGAYWGADNKIIYGEYEKAMMQVSAEGGIPEELFKGDALYYFHPQLLPDGKSLLFTLSPYPYSIAARSPGSPKAKPIILEGARAFYLPTGHLVYAFKNMLNAVAFDSFKLVLTGAPVSVAEGVYRITYDEAPQFDISPSGTLIYAQPPTADNLPKRTLVWVTRDGKEEPINIPPHDYGENWSAPKISPSGTKLAFAVTVNGNIDIWIFDLVRKSMTRITNDAAEDNWPLWTRDGQKIIYRSSSDQNNFVINKRAADGSGEAENIGSMQNYPELYSWSKKDEKILANETLLNPRGLNIVELSIKGSFQPKRLIEGKNSVEAPQISPDGKWLAYDSDQSGHNEVYVRPFPDVNKEGGGIVSTDGGYGPLWSPDGREIFYRNGESVMVVAVGKGPIFEPGKPEVLFKGKYFSKNQSTASYPVWDVSPDGKRFLMVKETGSAASTAGGARKIIVVMNWLEELKKQVPLK